MNTRGEQSLVFLSELKDWIFQTCGAQSLVLFTMGQGRCYRTITGCNDYHGH